MSVDKFKVNSFFPPTVVSNRSILASDPCVCVYL